MADLDTKYVLVPREPTREMERDALTAFYGTIGPHPIDDVATVHTVYRAMIAAAPALPPVAADDVTEMVKRLRDRAADRRSGVLDPFVADVRAGHLEDAAAMLEALSQSREADRVRARNEGIEMAVTELKERAEFLRGRAEITVRDWCGPDVDVEDRRANHADARNDRNTAAIYDQASSVVRALKEPE